MRRTTPGRLGGWMAILVLAAALGAASAAHGDEFIGPLAGWADAKAHYGAVADGRADDTAALQTALDDLRQESGTRRVLVLPAGTYRITRTLQLLRAKHHEATGISLLGEDPATTVLRWDGPEGGVMFLYNPWYARIGRLTMDGAGKARTALQHGEQFTTFNEIADMVFRDVQFGIEAGLKAGIAETAVLRCRFLRCSKAAVSIQNWNSLDWWLWHCRFEDCLVGVTNRYGAGHFHVYESVFRRSAEADMTMGNTSYFGVRGNFSSGSKAFFVASPFEAGAQITLQDNTVVDPQDAAPVRIANRGPVLLLDNVLAGRADLRQGPVVELADHTHAVSVGNTFTVAEAIRHGSRFAAMDDRVVGRGEVNPAEPALPGPLAGAKRPVIEVAGGADAAAIQKALDAAAAMHGRRPVVHLPAGRFRVDRTLTVPAGSDVQLVGDGPLNATYLDWAGQGAGPLLRLEGPSRATLREISLSGGKTADAVVLTAADQPGGRVFGEQLRVQGAEAGLLVDGLARTNVLLHDVGHDSSGVGVKVVGAGPATGAAGGRVIIFSGASSNNVLSYDVSGGGWLLARDIWYESGQQPRFMRCTDSGTFTLHGANVAYPRQEGAAGLEVDGFRGRLTFLGTLFTDVSGAPGRFPALVVKGEGPQTRVLALGVHGHGEYFRNESPQARAARLLSVQYTEGGGSKPIDDVGAWDGGFVREMLAQTRGVRPQPLGPVPEGATDVRFFRVITGGRNGVVIRPGP